MKDDKVIKPGSRWKSHVCSAEAIVVRPPRGEGVPECGGVAMSPLDVEAVPQTIKPGFEGGCLLGKRYRSESTGLEMLCTKPGAGALGFGGEVLEVLNAKPLPSSD
ncbi:hypothetical protein ACFSCW_06490 [Sphingomonas tabacisoli]|uniref:PDZ domain-containing protein n=1 Tax=Sphingomonas tabacisoli TaxID=2249466 RepID=A0ABW4I2N0_9SPHN